MGLYPLPHCDGLHSLQGDHAAQAWLEEEEAEADEEWEALRAGGGIKS